MPDATLFDDYVFVDWSANSRPKKGKDSIWLAHGSRPERTLRAPARENKSTRAQAFTHVRDLLRRLVKTGRRVLIGFDFPYGYPRGFAGSLRLPADPLGRWHAMWRTLAERIEDDERNRNNRFAVASELNARCGSGPGPFWGCPKRRRTRHLSPKRLPAKATWRAVEQVLRNDDKHPQEALKLLGAGSVGSQALLGIPYGFRLYHDELLAHCSTVWPFEPGSRLARPAPGPLVLHAEVWPGVVELDPSLHRTRDAAQVLTLVRWAAARDADGELACDLDRPFARAEAGAAYLLVEEGWILGV